MVPGLCPTLRWRLLLTMTGLKGGNHPMLDDALLHQAAQAIRSADALFIGAGAGMGVDSGLPDFRGDRGFWNAYPPYEKLGLNFVALANPRWFRTDPALAWGFYGHRLNLYRATLPHEGFRILRSWAERMRHGCFVFTSNVDGHFQRAGFAAERIVEVHGAIHWMQCLVSCGVGLFPAEAAGALPIAIDETTLRARDPLPRCPGCGGLARPNILMFGDAGWEEGRSSQQHQRMRAWLRDVPAKRLVVVECGAGTAIPTVRFECEWTAEHWSATLIRLNLRESVVPSGHIGLPVGALEGLRAIAERLG
jgi:NAD-dependent SIR2 family protein deacetylase